MFAQLAKMMGGGAGRRREAAHRAWAWAACRSCRARAHELAHAAAGGRPRRARRSGRGAGPILAEAGNLKNVLHQLKDSSVGQSMGQVDSMTLDIVAMLFDSCSTIPRFPSR
jgi:hypothetical protein